jgi:hypothetical protein
MPAQSHEITRARFKSRRGKALKAVAVTSEVRGQPIRLGTVSRPFAAALSEAEGVDGAPRGA